MVHHEPRTAVLAAGTFERDAHGGRRRGDGPRAPLPKRSRSEKRRRRAFLVFGLGRFVVVGVAAVDDPDFRPTGEEHAVAVHHARHVPPPAPLTPREPDEERALDVSRARPRRRLPAPARKRDELERDSSGSVGRR